MRHNSYIALISVLIIGAVLIWLLASVSISSVFLLTDANNDNDRYVAENQLASCTEDSLLRLNLTNSLPSQTQIENFLCNITINSHTGDNWDFSVGIEYKSYTYYDRIVATRTDKVTIVSWDHLK